jgi:hypothetical protein
MYNIISNDTEDSSYRIYLMMTTLVEACSVKLQSECLNVFSRTLALHMRLWN